MQKDPMSDGQTSRSFHQKKWKQKKSALVLSLSTCLILGVIGVEVIRETNLESSQNSKQLSEVPKFSNPANLDPKQVTALNKELQEMRQLLFVKENSPESEKMINIQTQLNEKEQVNRQLSNIIENLKQRLNDNKSKLAVMEATLISLNEMIDQQRLLRDKTQQQYTQEIEDLKFAFNQEREQLTAQLGNLEQNYAHLAYCLDDKKREIEQKEFDFTQKIDSLLVDLQNADAKWQQAQENYNLLKNESDVLAEHITRLEEERGLQKTVQDQFSQELLTSYLKSLDLEETLQIQDLLAVLKEHGLKEKNEQLVADLENRLESSLSREYFQKESEEQLKDSLITLENQLALRDSELERQWQELETLREERQEVENRLLTNFSEKELESLMHPLLIALYKKTILTSDKELHMQYQQLINELEEIRLEGYAKAEKIKQLENALNQSENNHQELVNLIETLEAQKNTLWRQQLQKASSYFEEKENSITKTLAEKEYELELALSHFSENLQAHLENENGLKEQIALLRTDIENKAAAFENLLQEHTSLSERHMVLESRLSEQQQAHEDAVAQLATRLSEQKQTHAQELEKMEARLAELQQHHASEIAQMGALLTEEAHKQAELAGYWEDEKTALTKQIENLQTLLAEERAQSLELGKPFAHMLEEQNAMDENIGKLEAALFIMNEQLKAL